jgi:hypothetical protein
VQSVDFAKNGRQPGFGAEKEMIKHKVLRYLSYFSTGKSEKVGRRK